MGQYSRIPTKTTNNKNSYFQEKRRDLELLKTYRPPWWDHGHRSEPCKLPSTKHSPTEEQFPDCLGFGKPGNGAPLRSGSGNVKAVLKLDPETRFQKRDRHQTLEVKRSKKFNKSSTRFFIESWNSVYLLLNILL